MPSKNTILQKTNWLYLILQLALFLIIALLFFLLKIEKYWLLALSIYFLFGSYLKIIIPKWHRKGLYYLRKGELEGAIFAFRKSYDFFTANNWVDKYRAFTLFSISALSYREMALMNMVFCYNKLGKNKEAQELQALLVKDYPNNPFLKK